MWPSLQDGGGNWPWEPALIDLQPQMPSPSLNTCSRWAVSTRSHAVSGLQAEKERRLLIYDHVNAAAHSHGWDNIEGAGEMVDGSIYSTVKTFFFFFFF